MITPEFTNYISHKLARGTSKEDISRVLIKNGWTKQDLDEAFSIISKSSSNLRRSSVANTDIKPLPNKTSKKLTVSLGLIIASAMYAFYQNTSVPSYASDNKSASDSAPQFVSLQTPSSSSPQPIIADNISTTAKPTKTSTTTPTKKVTSPTKTVVTKPKPTPAPTPAPAPKPKGQYTDGAYTGRAADAYYGNIQVEAVIRNGALADVIFLQHPGDRSTSIRINSRAMPLLKQEAISAQSANVNIVSGATDSSQAFQQSLSSALTQARA